MNRKIILTLISVALLAACNGTSKDTETYSSGFISMAVDASFAPIMESEVMVFESRYPAASINQIDTTETAAIDMLVKDSLRLVVATRPLHESEKAKLKEKQLYVKETMIALDAVALIVNPQNTDSLMSISTFRQILNGEVTQWTELNPDSQLGKINVVFDNERSSTVRFVLDSLLHSQKINATVYAQNNNSEVIDYVSRNPSALGVIGVNWIGEQANTTDSIRSDIKFSDRVRVLAMSHYTDVTPANSFKPFQAYMVGFADENGDWQKYPMTRKVYMLTTDPKGALPTGFINFVASDIGQRIILKSGLVPAIVNQIRLISINEE
jgi:phosphate transport system substrate-binding protein